MKMGIRNTIDHNTDNRSKSSNKVRIKRLFTSYLLLRERQSKMKTRQANNLRSRDYAHAHSVDERMLSNDTT